MKGFLGAFFDALGDVLEHVLSDWRQSRRSAARVIRRFPRTVVHRGVAISLADQRIALRLADPLIHADVERAIDQVARAARRDTALAAALAKLPDATPLAGSELAPGVELAPDGLQVGLLDGRLVAILDGVHHFWPTIERDPARIAKVIDRLRDHVRDHAAPYR